MAVVPFSLVDKWRAQCDAFGFGAEPTARVWIRRGHFTRGYRPWAGPPCEATILGMDNSAPWQAWWEPTTDWFEITGASNIDFTQGFDNNGLTVATITIENVAWVPQGIGGLISTMTQGWMAPTRGYTAPGRVDPGWDANGWPYVLRKNAQIMVEQGYDDDMVKTFTGLIDDIDPSGPPARLTISARDFGQVLVDEEFFGYNHDPLLREPITFVDRKWRNTHEGYDANASDSAPHHPPAYIADTDKNTFWLSREYNVDNATTWCEVHLPGGEYTSFYAWPRYHGMQMYAAVLARPRSDGKPCTLGGSAIPDNEWVDVGLDDVPGENGGFSPLRVYEKVDDVGRWYRFRDDGATLNIGPGSVLRVAFRNLAPVNDDDTQAKHDTGGYRAGMRRLAANKRSDVTKGAKQHYIATDDVADVVRVILRWAGFQEWDIESTGVRLSKPVVFNRGDKFIDAINKIAESTNYVFFIKDPSSESDLSIGIPCFRMSRVTTDDEPIIQVTDQDLVTQVQAKFTDEPLAYMIRATGKQLTNYGDGSGGDAGGGAGHRVRFTYYPPWGREWGDLAGVLKHVIDPNDQFATQDDCEFACYYIALREAIESGTATFQIPAFPGVELDDMVSLVDEATGLNTRVWIASRSSTFTVNDNVKTWVQSLGGSLADSPEVATIRDVINNAVRDNE